MDNKEYYSIKFIVIGETYVGKTTLIYNYSRNEFNNELNYSSTIGAEFSVKNIKTNDDKTLKLQLWDTAGMESFKSIRQTYYKNAACAIIVYDITNEDSLIQVDKWVEECTLYSNNDNLLIILVGNKTDKNEERKVKEKDGRNMAEKYGIDFYEISALTGYNVNEMFSKVCEKLYNSYKEKGDYNGISKITTNTNINDNEIKTPFLISINNDENSSGRRTNKKCCCC